MDKPAAAVAPVASQALLIKKSARQLAYDVRYKVRKQMKTTSGSNLDPASVRKAYEAELSKSKSPPAVKAEARRILLGEDYISESKSLAIDHVANALYKVFVENLTLEQPIVLPYLKELNDPEKKKYKIKVVDKKTGNSYIRMATREKISELRANPNIASVELVDPNDTREPYGKEASRGESTAKVKAGKGLDPVGEEDSDVNNDGKVDKTDDYLMNRRRVRGAAIARKKEGVSEEFLGELSDKNTIDVLSKNKPNRVVMSPEISGPDRKSSHQPMQVAHYDMQGNPLSESEIKFLEMLQEKKMTAKAKRKEKKLKSKYDDSEMKQKMIDKYGEEKGTEIYFATIRKQAMKEESDCDSQNIEDEEDPRSFKTKVNLVKNKLRAMGLKMSYEPESEMVEARRYYGRGRSPDRNAVGGADRNNSPRYRNLGSPTDPAEIADEEKRAAEARARFAASDAAYAEERRRKNEQNPNP